MTWPPFLGAIVALAVAVWGAFYLLGSPLNAAETVVVVGLCAVIAYGVRAAVRRLRKAPDPAPAGPKVQPKVQPKTKPRAKPKGRH
jgi:hypothetical protein